MMHFRPVFGASALALLISAPAAFADVSAADIWAQWQDYLSRSGQTVTTGSEQMAGDTLTVTDVGLSMTSPEFNYSATIPSLTFKENGDGTVTISMSPEYPMTLDLHPEGEPATKVEMTIRQSNLAMTASGTKEAVDYAISADEVAVDLGKVTVESNDGITLDGSLTLDKLSGSYSFKAGTPQIVTSALKAASMKLDIDFKDATDANAMSMNVEATDVVANSDGAMPDQMNFENLPAAFAAGFGVSGALTYGNASYNFSFDDGSDSVQGTAMMASGSLEYSLKDGGIKYLTRSTGLDVNLSGPSIPMPVVNFKLAESAFGVTMPLAKSAEPKDFGLLMRMVGLEVPPEIWNMVDPGQQLPRDPANLILDLKGKGNWLIDIMAPDAQAPSGDEMPAEIQSLNIDELELTAIGASVTGTGAFTFDNQDIETWGGMPAPEGSIDLQIVGLSGLIDKLVGMGMIPQDQAMGAKMMMGMFAKPGNGPDTMTSKIEVTKDGHVYANGQQLQ